MRARCQFNTPAQRQFSNKHVFKTGQIKQGVIYGLDALLKAPLAAILMTSVIFALCHVPGLYLRGTPETQGYSSNLFQVTAYTIAALSPLSIALGLLWARTRNLLLVVLVHGAIDALPFTAEFVKIWG